MLKKGDKVESKPKQIVKLELIITPLCPFSLYHNREKIIYGIKSLNSQAGPRSGLQLHFSFLIFVSWASFKGASDKGIK